MEIITTLLLTAGILAIVCIWLLTKTVSAIWRSRLFWAALLFLSIVAIPVTFGASFLVIAGIIVLRIFLIGKVLEDPKQ